MHHQNYANGSHRILRELACVLAVTISAYAVPFPAKEIAQFEDWLKKHPHVMK